MRKAVIPAFTLVSLWFLLSSCEKEPGSLVDPPLTSPTVSSVSFHSYSVNLDDAGSAVKQVDGSYNIADSVLAEVSNPTGAGNIGAVYFRVYEPGSPDPGRTDELTPTGLVNVQSGNASYTGVVNLNVVRSRTGLYRVEVFAKDKAGNQGNSLIQPISVVINNQPPHMALPALRRFAIPGTDSAVVTVSTGVSDSNGFDDIASVTALAVKGPGDTLSSQLFDDGLPVHADRFPGDGVFSTQFRLDTASLSVVEFQLYADDRSGFRSNIVKRTLKNFAPSIVSLLVPDSIKIPAEGIDSVVFAVKVTDPDSLSDIDSVYFRNFSSSDPTRVFLMYDDGVMYKHGDATAHDGIYSLVIYLYPPVNSASNDFHFYVVDKSGASDERRKTIYAH